MKKLYVLLLAAVMLTALTGCAKFLPGTKSTSGTDAVSSTQIEESVSASDSTEDDDDLNLNITYRAIAAEWPKAESDEDYLKAARERLDEYTQLITSLSSMTDGIAGRCRSAEAVSADEEFDHIHASFVQWSKNVQKYDASSLGEGAAAVHQKLIELADLTDEYMAAYPSACLAEDKSELDGYQSEIIMLMLELNAAV